LNRYNLKITGGTGSGKTSLLILAVVNHLRRFPIKELIWITDEESSVDIVDKLTMETAGLVVMPDKLTVTTVDAIKLNILTNTLVKVPLVVCDATMGRSLLILLKLLSMEHGFTLLYTKNTSFSKTV